MTHFLPLLKVKAEAIAPLALVVGDPARAEQAAKILDTVQQVGQNREYITYTGSYNDQLITICSHGIGSAGAGICFEELARAGVKIIIRAGTCGAVQDHIQDGDLIIATGAVREEGLTPRLVPSGYPAVADYRVVMALETAAQQVDIQPHTGLALTSDLFYPSSALGQEWHVWKESRIVAVEMELAALFIIASLHNIQAGGILTVDGNPTQAAQDMSDYDPYRPAIISGKAQMLQIALHALHQLGQVLE